MLRVAQNKFLKDPANPSGLVDIATLAEMLEGEYLPFFIPDHISDNALKKAYKTGFINELYSIVFPSMLRKDVFDTITKKYHIFIDTRQFQKDVKKYGEEKYSTFIRN